MPATNRFEAVFPMLLLRLGNPGLVPVDKNRLSSFSRVEPIVISAFDFWRLFQAVLRGIENVFRFVAFFADLKRVPRHRDFRPAQSKKSTHAQDRESHMSRLWLDEQFIDVADILFLQVRDFCPFDFRSSKQCWITPGFLLLLSRERTGDAA